MIQANLRNFAIIAHVDHGKSTLSDRLLEITGTIAKDKLQEQFLDQNPISRERGITIKLAPVRMELKWVVDNGQWKIIDKHDSFVNAQLSILNLIDTPGHVDFSYEVSRTLAACEGAVLLVDATQGVQAQTVAHLRVAQKLELTIIPVINKIDMPAANVQQVEKQLVDMFSFSKEEMHYISAKTGEGVPELLQDIIRKIPAPQGDPSASLRALIFDAIYDEHRGVVAQVRIVDGNLKKNDQIILMQNNTKAMATDVGYFTPFLTAAPALNCGEIGYIVTGIKDIRQVRVGDTVTNAEFRVQNSELKPLPGYVTPQPMVFFGVYPESPSEYRQLKDALEKLMLQDASLTISEEYSAFLGSGFRMGFLGLLHAEIVKDRLTQEFNVTPLLTMPHVLYKGKASSVTGEENKEILNDQVQKKSPQEEELEEPYMKLTIYVPNEYVGAVMTLCQKRKGELVEISYQDTYAVITYEMPYSMFVRGISAELKSATSGYASFDYELSSYKPADLVTLEVRINDEPIDVLSEKLYRDEANYVARRKAEQLKETLPRAQFRQIIQGVINNQIVAREEISPFRKDVLAKMSGGDRTRKDKLLEAQKKGKSRLKTHGKIQIPQAALLGMIKGS